MLCARRDAATMSEDISARYRIPSCKTAVRVVLRVIAVWCAGGPTGWIWLQGQPKSVQGVGTLQPRPGIVVSDAA